ncbi:hypothetical protein LARV_00142 [Longilinea arvoryzae]|uniref:Uncharacterized protein n=1 Tax=Longilinea arvoryzae TaxID=360412 RepID=A0A0S7B605_9CHLR|nr:hypothetical protein [Longilinea arvoryzae]GAP12407.1 hypothetical protein LARV_00142 [Longilinea arvoryzae]
MDRRQKEELRILLKARKRADKVLAERREAAQEKLDRNMRKAANQELMQEYTRKFTALAEKCGILALAEEAARKVNGCFFTKMSYYIDYGMNTSHLSGAFFTYKDGVLRPAYLGIFITWDEGEAKKEVEIRYAKNGAVTFHHSRWPIFPFIWKNFPKVLPQMVDQAMKNPRKPEPAPRHGCE